MFFTVPAAIARAADFYVSKSGSDTNAGTLARPFLTIKRGVRFLAPGDKLFVRAGEYDERIDFLVGGTSWDNPITVAAFPGETVVIKPSLKNPKDYRVLFFGDSRTKYLIIDGLIVDGTNVVSEAIKVTWSGFEAAPSTSHHIRLQNTEVRNAPFTGILVTSDPSGTSGNNEFTNMNVHGNGFAAPPGYGHGFYISGENNIVEQSDIHNNAGYGVHVYNGTGVGANNTVVRYNKIHDNGQSGAGPGMIIGSGNGNVAYNNLIWGNSTGMQIAYGGSNNQAYNNTIVNNTRGTANNLCVIVQATSPPSVVQNNICVGHTRGIENYSANTVITHNRAEIVRNFGAGRVLLSNNISGDPRFINQNSGNFRLREASPAIDSGVSVSAIVHDDFDGIPRPNGPAYDMGAFEFVLPSPQVPSLVDGKVGKAFGFNGFNYVRVPYLRALGGTTPFTVTGWIFAESSEGALLSTGDSAASNEKFVSFGVQDGKPTFAFLNNKLVGKPIPSGAWVHLAFTWDGVGTKRKIYVNGVLDAEDPSPNNTPLSILSGAATEFGGWIGRDLTSRLIGKIDELRIYYRSLPAWEIFAHYQSMR